MAAGFVSRLGGWLLPVGMLVFLALVTWRIELPLKIWWAACESIAVLVLVGHHLWLEARHRRWNDRALAALHAGQFDTHPAPRGSLAILGMALGFALTGFVLLVFDLVRWYV